MIIHWLDFNTGASNLSWSLGRSFTFFHNLGHILLITEENGQNTDNSINYESFWAAQKCFWAAAWTLAFIGRVKYFNFKILRVCILGMYIR
jgi:hypothetical protein